MKITTSLDKNKKYLLACSLGPDSMSLFDYLVKENIYFEVVHVNYHILEQADDDEKGIRDYALKFNIKVHVLETNMPLNVNEEDRARDVRYEYFGEIADKVGIHNVLVAHNEDDLIETYLLQKDRQNIVSTYGLKEVLNRKNYRVIRPLLKYKKKDLLKYCEDNEILYSIDPSNFDTKFKRNKIRSEIISNLTDEDRKAVLEEIFRKNTELASFLKVNTKILKKNRIKVDKKFFERFPSESFELFIIEYLKDKGIYVPISKGMAFEIYRAIHSKKANWKRELKKGVYLYFEYGYLSIHKDQIPYEFIVNRPDEIGLFTVNSQAENFEIVKDKFPLVIKPVETFESFKYDGKTLKVNRQFISWKVPLSIRDIWPGIYDQAGNLIYVPKYQEGKVKNNGLLKFKLNDIYI